MSHDEHARRLDDIEKRLARLERAAERQPVFVSIYDKVLESEFAPYCPCGRDVCRAPDCPSHRSDPMGR